MYRVEVDWAPAYELIVSLQAFVSKREHKAIDLGPEWARTVRGRLSAGLLSQLTAKVGDDVAWFSVLVARCPGTRDVEQFLEWAGALSVGELYELFVPQAGKKQRRLPADLGGFRDRITELLSGWNQEYFRQVDPALLDGLAAEAAWTQKLAAEAESEPFVESTTGGLHILPAPGLEVVMLVPQYHYRPFNVHSHPGTVRFIQYPCDPLPPTAGEPPSRLLRLARSLSDESRLRMLRYVAEQPRTFTDIRRFTGLSKSTVNHHMVALRASGLVRVHDTGQKAITYTFRSHAVDQLGDNLRVFLGGDASKDARYASPIGGAGGVK